MDVTTISITAVSWSIRMPTETLKSPETIQLYIFISITCPFDINQE
jgi:hypothetical protein